MGLRSIQSQRPPGSFGSCSRKTNCGAEPCSSLSSRDYPQAVELGPLALVRVLPGSWKEKLQLCWSWGLLLGTDHLQQRQACVFQAPARGTSSRPPQCSGRRGSCVPWGTGAEMRRSFDFIGRERNEQVDKLLLAGYGAAVPELAAFSEGQLGLEAVLGIPLDLCATKRPNLA